MVEPRSVLDIHGAGQEAILNLGQCRIWARNSGSPCPHGWTGDVVAASDTRSGNWRLCFTCGD